MGKYNVVIINPKILIGNENMENLWKKTSITKQLLNFIFDEGHIRKTTHYLNTLNFT